MSTSAEMDEYFRNVVQDLENRMNDPDTSSREKVKKVLNQFNNPQDDQRTVLVAGTNGKGSTVEMINEALRSNGHDVGTFKSPHLVSLRERIKYNQEMISKEAFLNIYEELEKVKAKLSFFEFMTAAGYIYFSERDVDYAVVEVGVGGKEDATNVVQNEVSVLTNLGFDHEEYLGKSKKEIASQKLGVLEENSVLVTEVERDYLKDAEKLKADIQRPKRVEEENGEFIFNNERFSIPVEGVFQRKNLENALEAVKVIDKVPEDLQKTFGDLKCPGRMEIVSESIPYIHDGAHNPHALRTVLDELPEDFHCIFSATKKKKVSEMIEILEEKASKFYFTRSDVDWCIAPEEMAEHCSTEFECFDNPREAESKAVENSNNSPVVATGSLYLIGNLKNFNRVDL